MDPNLDAALAHISNALDDLDSSPDQRPVPLLREAMAHIRAAAAPAAAQEAVTIDADAYHAMNGELCDFAIRWRLDGDYLRCTGCNRPQLTNYAGEAFAHAGGCKRADTTETHPWLALRRIMRPMFAPVTAAPAEMSPEFTDTARAAIAWVLWHHQGASSPVGQPLRFALGMGADEPLPVWRIAEAKRYAEFAGATTAEFHNALPGTPAAPGIDLYPIRCALQYAAAAARENTHTEMAEGFDALIRKIDASPKGDEAQRAGAQAIAIVHMDGYRWNGQHWQKDSPKGALNEQFGSAEGLDSPKGGSASQQADAKRLDFLIRTYSHLRMRNGAWVVAVGGETPAPGEGYPTAHAAIDAAMANERATDFAAAGVAAGPCPVCSEAGPCACGGAP